MLTQKLAEFVINTTLSDMPQEALDGARDALIDTIGCALAGTPEEVCRIVVRYLRAQEGNAQATVWGIGLATTASDAAFANGVFSHALDYDDTQSNLRGHPSAALAPAILAVGEYAHASVGDALGAYVVGVDGQPLDELLGRLAQPWEVIKPGLFFKRWPCCYCNHRSIGGLLQMIPEHGLTPDEIEAIEIGFPPGSDTALIASDPRTGLQGKFSIEYVAAATLLDGKVTLESFTDEMVNRPEVRRLMQKVRRYRIEDSRTFAGTVGYNDLTVRTTRGEFKMHVDKTPGSPVWPVSEGERDEKFLDCAGRVLGGAAARELLDLLLNCRALADVGPLVRATVPRTNP